MIILTIRDGILKEIIKEKEQDEMKKDNWQYRLTSASGEFAIIDYDKDLARPYVKAILAKVNKLKEVKMLWAVIFILTFAYISFIALFFIQYFSVNDLRKDISKISIPKTATIQNAPDMNRILQQNTDFNSLEEETAGTGKTIKTPSSNHLLR